MDKNSKFLRQREIEEDGQKTGRLREEVICTEEIFKAIQNAISILHKSNVSFEFHSYNATPTFSLICVDKKMFIGPYCYGEHGYTTPWIEISGDEKKKEYSEYKEVFNALWESKGKKR